LVIRKEIAVASSSVQAMVDLEYHYAAAVRFILYKIWCDCGDLLAERQVWPLLGHSWAAGVLQSMKAHHLATQSEKIQRRLRLAEERAEKLRIKKQRKAEREK
jgi:hypothetical protein